MEVVAEGRAIPLDRQRMRALLAYLLLHANELVSSDRLIDELWGLEPSRTAAASLRNYISKIRKLLGPGILVSRPPGYLLRVPADAIDLRRFERLVGQAQSDKAANPKARVRKLDAALALWRGSALADFVYEPFAQAEIARLEEMRLVAIETRIEAELELGISADVLGELQSLVATHPVRERLHKHLMLALYRSGRQIEALEAYRAARHALIDEHGLEPTRELQELERAILTQDPSLEPPLLSQRRPQLPTPVTHLIGREREVEDLVQMLAHRDVRLITLTGSGGVGKTRLALQVVSKVEDDFEAAYFVDLAPLQDSSLVVPTIQAVIGTDIELEEVVGERRVLFLLDNFEQVIEAAPELARLLSVCPGVVVIVTSRERLQLAGEREYEVGPLEESPSVELFRERARAVLPSFEEGYSQLAAVCARVDRLPLAIELAAARVKVVQPDAMLERLTERLHLLTGGRRDAPSRQRTLRATIEWSYELLAEEERRLFMRLGVFTGGFTIYSAEDICNADLDSVQSLADKSLIRGASDRFAMLETVREYAIECLDESGEAADLAARHAEHFLALAEQAYAGWEGHHSTWIRRLNNDYDNLRGALLWARQRNEEVEFRLVRALRHFWAVRGLAAEGRMWTMDALARANTDADLRAGVLETASTLAGAQGDLDELRRISQERLELARARGDEQAVAASIGNLGYVAAGLGDHAQAEALHKESLALHRALGVPEGVAVSLQNLADLAVCQRDFEVAEGYLAEAFALFREADSEGGLAHTYLVSGALALQTGRHEQASEDYAASAELFRSLMHGGGIGLGLQGLAAVAAEEGNVERAARLLGAAERMLEETGTIADGSVADTSARAVATLSAKLDEEALRAAWAEGRSMDRDAAIDYAGSTSAVLTRGTGSE